MRWKSLAIAFVACAFLTGQIGFNGKFKKLEIGMSREQVVALLGRPDGVRTHEQSEALIYADRLMSGFKWSRADYVVVLRDGLIVEYGPGSIRDASPNTGALIFVPL